MKKIFAMLSTLLLGSSFAFGACPTTAVSSSGVVDSDGFTWKSGTVTANFVPVGGSFFNQNTCTGGTFTQQYKATMDSSGAFTINLPKNTSILPLGSQWALTLCPNATRGCYTYTASITGTTLDLTSPINAVLPGPRFVQGLYSYGYGPVEVTSTITTGAFFYDVTVGACKQYTGAAWGLCPSNASTYDSTNVAITGGTIDGVVIGGDTPAAGTFADIIGDSISTPSIVSTGTKFSVAGCGSATSLVGGSLAGKFVAAQAGCTPVITTNLTAPTGYSCWMNDQTTSTVKFQQTATSQTTATFTATGTLGGTDTINFGCLEY